MLRDTGRAMSKENVDLVRSLYTAWERGDFSTAGWAHPEIEWVIADGPTAGTWKGLAGMRESFAGMLGAWDDFRGEAEEYRQLDDERFLVLSQFRGKGKTSGLEIGQKGADLLHVRDGMVTRCVHYYDRQRAFADLGLSEQDAHADCGTESLP
jgi:ketosteroid isomerase-like protein